MKLHLDEISLDTWQDCARLRVTPNQIRFIPNNLWALAECKFLPDRIPLGIYDDSTLVGMVVCSYDEQLGQGNIHRLVIGEGFEGRGYSTNTMQWLIRRFRRIPGCRRVWVSWHPQNQIIADFYRSYGFKETGQSTPEGELIAVLNISPLQAKDSQNGADATPEPTPDDSSTGTPTLDSTTTSAPAPWTRPAAAIA